MFLYIIINFKKYDCKFLSQFYLCSDNLSLSLDLSIYISCFKFFLKIYARKSQSRYNILKSIVTSPKLYRYRLKQAILNMPNRTTSLRIVGDDIIPFLPFDPASVAASQSFASWVGECLWRFPPSAKQSAKSCAGTSATHWRKIRTTLAARLEFG